MRIKPDENLPLRLASSLKNLNHDVQTVWGEGLTGRAEREIWETAQREARFLITRDLDFSDSRQLTPGSHHGILLIRLRSPNRSDLIVRVGEFFQNENVNGWLGCFVVATEHKLRVLKPPTKQV